MFTCFFKKCNDENWIIALISRVIKKSIIQGEPRFITIYSTSCKKRPFRAHLQTLIMALQMIVRRDEELSDFLFDIWCHFMGVLNVRSGHMTLQIFARKNLSWGPTQSFKITRVAGNNESFERRLWVKRRMSFLRKCQKSNGHKSHRKAPSLKRKKYDKSKSVRWNKKQPFWMCVQHEQFQAMSWIWYRTEEYHPPHMLNISFVFVACTLHCVKSLTASFWQATEREERLMCSN